MSKPSSVCCGIWPLLTNEEKAAIHEMALQRLSKVGIDQIGKTAYPSRDKLKDGGPQMEFQFPEIRKEEA